MLDRRGFIASLLAAPALAALPALPDCIGYKTVSARIASRPGPMTLLIPDEPGFTYMLGSDKAGWTELNPGEFVTVPESGSGSWFRMQWNG